MSVEPHPELSNLRTFPAPSIPGLPPDARRFGRWRAYPARREAVLKPLEPWQLRGEKALRWLQRLMVLAAVAAVFGLLIFLWRMAPD